MIQQNTDNADKIQIFITHYINKDMIELNDVLIDEIIYMEKITHCPHDIIVVYYCPDGDNSDKILYDRLPKNIKLVKNDRPGRPDIQPSLRNKIIDMANTTNPFVLLHNDIRVSIGWLESLVAEIDNAEKRWGKGNVVISPRFIHYHTPYHIRIISDEFSNWSRSYTGRILDANKMREWCKQWNFDFDNGNNVHSLNPVSITDDGHQLMMFISRKEFFVGNNNTNGIGYCDESFSGTGYDDNDWGIRALMAGKKNLKSQSSLIGHIEGLSFGHKNIPSNTADNAKIFKKKWGDVIFDEMQTGQLWIRLHQIQIK